jgi:acylphosphatase
MSSSPNGAKAESPEMAGLGNKNRRVALRIHGRVQGVFYRRDARQEALRLGLSGFVRNEPDDSVYAEAEGPGEKVGAFIRWCRKGPPHAVVESVETEELPVQGNDGFVVRY